MNNNHKWLKLQMNMKIHFNTQIKYNQHKKNYSNCLNNPKPPTIKTNKTFQNPQSVSDKLLNIKSITLLKSKQSSYKKSPISWTKSLG